VVDSVVLLGYTMGFTCWISEAQTTENGGRTYLVSQLLRNLFRSFFILKGGDG